MNLHYEVGRGESHLGVFARDKHVGDVVIKIKPGTTSVERFQFVSVDGTLKTKLHAECENCMDELETMV